jgi:hypothetical protein
LPFFHIFHIFSLFNLLFFYIIRALVYSKNPISPKDVQCRQVLLYLDGYCNYMNEGKWKWAVMYMCVRGHVYVC